MQTTASFPFSLPRTLRRYYRRLHRHFGRQQWWPARTRFEVILGALLTQNTAWVNVKRALSNLRRAGVLSPKKLARVPRQRLTRYVRPSGYFRQKSRYLRGFLEHLQKHYQGSLPRLLRQPAPALRQELLSLPGIGPETANSILLYAAGHPVFVIDAYTRRVLARHGLAGEKASYEELQDFFHQNLPRDARLFNEYHALLVAVGKEYCHRVRPDCNACPLGIELEPAHGRS
ncbi:MAG: endonuclease III domain-containing protein [Candidatus Acidiferrales bacterium]